jgi:hypothetical protein
MAAITKMTVADLRGAVVRARSAAARIKEEAALATERAVTTMSTAAGGAAVAALEASVADDNIPGTEVPIGAVAGLALAVAGATGMGGKQGEALGAFGAGMLSVYAYKFAQKTLAEKA